MAERAPAFQFYPKDFLADGKVAEMSLQERGAYITLLSICWIEGSLPADVGRIARLVGATRGQMQKLWPSVGQCFKPHPSEVGRLVHPRLEREREKQDEFRRRQSDNGRRGGRPRKPEETQTKPTQNPSLSSGLSQTKAKKSSSSSSAVCDLLSAEKKTDGGVDARSKRPIFRGQRFVVFEWMVDDLSKLLGPHFETFNLHAWFCELDERYVQTGAVLPQRDGGKWLQEQTLAEAVRRGLPLAAAGSVGKTAGNVAAAARFVSRGGTS